MSTGHRQPASSGIIYAVPQTKSPVANDLPSILCNVIVLAMKQDLVTFIETSIFTKQIDKLATIEVLFDLQNDLLSNPHRGAVIQGTGGARKARVGEKQKGRGKSGGFRYIYFYFEHAGRIYLLLFFAKNEQETLSMAEKKLVADFIDMSRKNLEKT